MTSRVSIGSLNLLKKQGNGLFALVLVGAVVFFKLFLFPEINQVAPFLLFATAVLLSTWFWGRQGGIIATVSSTLVIANTFLPEIKGYPESVKFLMIAVFLLECSVILLIGDLKARAEKALVPFQAIIDSSDDAIFSANLDGVVLSWNRGAEKLYGYSPDEIIGQNMKVLYPEGRKREIDKFLAVIRAGKAVEHFNTIGADKLGQPIDVSVTVSPILKASGGVVGASAITRNISKEKEAERRKNDFISIASHELKTPLTTIKAYMQIIKGMVVGRKDLVMLGFVGKAEQQLDRLTELVGDLLDLSKIQAGRLAFRMEYFGYMELVSETLEHLQGISIHHELKLIGPARIRVYGDKNRLQQVLVNLVTNAIKYSPNTDRVIIKIKREGNVLLTSVQDFGIGIPKKYHSQIFDRFFRIESERQKTFPGLGMGLFIASEIVKRHGGKIWVESAENKGSTFYFSLPVSKGSSTGNLSDR